MVLSFRVLQLIALEAVQRKLFGSGLINIAFSLVSLDFLVFNVRFGQMHHGLGRGTLFDSPFI